MPSASRTRYTRQDLERFPDDNVRREVIDGELFAWPSPDIRHQRVITHLMCEMYELSKTVGGEVYPPLTAVLFSETDVVQPDVLYVRPEHIDRIGWLYIMGPPDVVVEVSEVSTRRYDLLRKRPLYEQFGVPEFWYVDLEADRLEVYTPSGNGYEAPRLLGRRDALSTPHLPGLALSVNKLLGPTEEDDEETPSSRS